MVNDEVRKKNCEKFIFHYVLHREKKIMFQHFSSLRAVCLNRCGLPERTLSNGATRLPSFVMACFLCGVRGLDHHISEPEVRSMRIRGLNTGRGDKCIIRFRLSGIVMGRRWASKTGLKTCPQPPQVARNTSKCACLRSRDALRL